MSEITEKIIQAAAITTQRRTELVAAIADKGVTLSDDATLLQCIEGIGSIDTQCSDIVKVLIDGTITECDIPEGVASLPDYAFHNCTNLQRVSIPDSMKSIDSYAFYNCSGLTSIVIPSHSSLRGIYYGAFMNCSNLTSITIPDSVTSISSHAFDKCSSLTSVAISNSLSIISESVFGNSGLTSVDIPDSVQIIQDCAFLGCRSLSAVTIGEKIGSIHDYVFSGCIKLTTVTCKATTPPTLSSKAFSGCSALAHIYVPADSVDAYKTATNWNAYADIIEAIPTEEES